MNPNQRIERLQHQIDSCIYEYKCNRNTSTNYLYEFQRYKMMGELLIEKYNHDKLEYLVDVELPRLIGESSQLN